MSSNAAVANVIYEKVKLLPKSQQKEALSFVDYLSYKSRQEDRLWMKMSLQSALKGLEDEEWPDYASEDLKERWV